MKGRKIIEASVRGEVKKPKTDEFLIDVNRFVFPKKFWQFKETDEHYVLVLNEPKGGKK